MSGKIHIGRIAWGEPAFPAKLKEIKDSPRELYYIGDASILKERCISVIGSRTTTVYGRNTARSIGRRLGELGVTVVSGMASGIDTCAHEGAMSSGGNTIAVLGCGVDVCYPRDNLPLKQRIEKLGLVISEYPPGTEPMAFRFPQRNRIISGISEATVVVQARNDSGSLITAELAAEQGRDVFSVPGNIDSQNNLGSNKLLQEGAVPIVRISDIAEILGIKNVGNKSMISNLTPLEQMILSTIKERGEMSPDELCIRLKDTPQRITPALSVLEIKGFLCSASGKFFLAKE